MNTNYRNEETRKLITFDIDTKELEKYYPTNNWKHVYEIIKKYMLKKNFEHIQGSVYVSKEPITYYRVIAISKTLVSRYPYLHKSIRGMIVTEVGEVFNMNFLLNRDYPVIPKKTLDNN